MKRLINSIILDETGYGVVELLIIVAGLGFLSSMLMFGLQGSLTGEDGTGGATGLVGEKITDILEKW